MSVLDIFILVYVAGYISAAVTYIYRNGYIGAAPLVGILFPLYFYTLYELCNKKQ